MLEEVRTFIAEAGRDGVGRPALAKRFHGQRMDRENALAKLVALGDVTIVRWQNPRGGPRTTVYRAWTRYRNSP